MNIFFYKKINYYVNIFYSFLERKISRINIKIKNKLYSQESKDLPLDASISLNYVVNKGNSFLLDARIVQSGTFAGYRHSFSTTKPVLYATISSLLLKHLYSAQVSEKSTEEIKLLLKHQSDDGLFRDPVIACQYAEDGDSWGWRHLTLHALMTLALYDVPASKELRFLERFGDKDGFRNYLRSRDWGARVAWTSNELQNIGVMLQYARDYQHSMTASGLLEILFEVIEEHQDQETGLYGDCFSTPEKLSLAVQAGYHFWLLFFYDQRPIRHAERIIDNLLMTQNILGGYGVKWHSSACEDIDSIDPLVRFSRITNYRFDDIQRSLQRALPAILQNLNPDGGWVFRRHEALTIVHPQMFSNQNESNLFFTWFRTLGLAYCLSGLQDVPNNFVYPWNFKRAPGHQFL